MKSNTYTYVYVVYDVYRFSTSVCVSLFFVCVLYSCSSGAVDNVYKDQKALKPAPALGFHVYLNVYRVVDKPWFPYGKLYTDPVSDPSLNSIQQDTLRVVKMCVYSASPQPAITEKTMSATPNTQNNFPSSVTTPLGEDRLSDGPAFVSAPAPASVDPTDDIPDSTSFFEVLGLAKGEAEGKFAPIPGVDPLKDAEQAAKKPRAARKTAVTPTATAQPLMQAPEAAAGDEIPTTGYAALGVTGDGERGVLWSYYGNTITTFGSGDYFNKSKLMNACGQAFLLANHSRQFRGATVVDYEAAGSALNLATKQAGLYVEENVIGGGVRRDGDRVVVNSFECFDAATGKLVDRAGTDTGIVYLRNHDLGIKPDQQVGTKEDAAKLYDAITTWKWENGSTDALMVFGGTMSGYLVGWSNLRPHLVIHSPQRGCGKSALKKLQLGILGGACISRSNQGEAGLRSLLRKRSIAVLLDEMGGKGEKRDKTYDYLKQAFDGEDGETKGGQDSLHHIDFEIRSMAIMYRIDAPEFKQELNSRVYMAGLTPYETEKDEAGRPVKSTAPKHELFPAADKSNAKQISALGKRLFARMLHSVPRLEKTISSLNDAFKAGARASDTLVPFMAAAYVALHDDAIEDLDHASQWIDEFNFENELNRIENVRVDNDFEKALMSSVVSVDVPNLKTKVDMRLDELMGHAVYDTKGGPFVGKLSNLGLRLRPETEKCQGPDGSVVKVPVKNAEGVAQWQLCIEMAPVQAFRKLFIGSGFDENNLRGLIKSIPGASQKEGNPDIRFGPGSPSKYLTIPYWCPDKADLRPLASSIN